MIEIGPNMKDAVESFCALLFFAILAWAIFR